MRKGLLILLLLCVAACMCGCSILPDESAEVLPDLRLLERPVYADEAVPAGAAPSSQDVFRLDLWLDATPNMGGINIHRLSLYPHYSTKYREGGFHYRFGNETGMYESVLRGMLSAAEGSRVRLLRYGSERLPDEYLMAEGVADPGADSGKLRSLRRDMLTFAIDPLPGVFSSFSSERMTDSFYTPGTPMLNRMGEINHSLLENPAKAEAMTVALEKQAEGIRKESDPSLIALDDDSDYALLYALDNLDPSRLSVITCDPASIRRLNPISSDGAPVALVEQLMKERGIFDAGLSVGIYAFTLDYMGQMSSFADADFSEPLLWGKLKYNNSKKRIESALPMPRILLAIVVGREAQVDEYTGRLNAELASSDALKELRGPENGELTYARGGETIAQQPFGFTYEYTQITRPALSAFTHQSSGVALASAGETDQETRLVSLAAGKDASITASVPAENPAARLTALSLKVDDALLLTRTLSSTEAVSLPEKAQVIALRDRLYVYEHCQPEAAFHLEHAGEQDGKLVFTISAGADLEPGYYRLSLSADYADGAVEWETAPWIGETSVSISNEEISAWESFTGLMTAYDRKRANIPRAFQHAWGPATDALYHNQPYPDFPPVYKAPGLAELVRQLQSAAAPLQSPCLRYTFDVFVNNP